MKFSRTWAMPNLETFSCKPIGEFVRRYLKHSKCSVDPFARDKDWFTYTNDFNPNTKAEYHFEAKIFLDGMRRREVECDLLIFDPPYSPRQLKECYNSFGRKMTMEDGQTGRLRKEWRDAAMPILTPDAVVLSFGWNTCGFGRKHGFKIEEILLVCHGGDHYDTICMAERRLPTSEPP